MRLEIQNPSPPPTPPLPPTPPPPKKKKQEKKKEKENFITVISKRATPIYKSNVQSTFCIFSNLTY